MRSVRLLYALEGREDMVVNGIEKSPFSNQEDFKTDNGSATKTSTLKQKLCSSKFRTLTGAAVSLNACWLVGTIEWPFWYGFFRWWTHTRRTNHCVKDLFCIQQPFTLWWHPFFDGWKMICFSMFSDVVHLHSNTQTPTTRCQGLSGSAWDATLTSSNRRQIWHLSWGRKHPTS